MLKKKHYEVKHQYYIRYIKLQYRYQKINIGYSYLFKLQYINYNLNKVQKYIE